MLDKADKKKFMNELEGYGIERIDYLLARVGHRLRIFSGNIGKHELIRLIQNVRVDNFGLYFASLKEGFRLNLDAVHMLKNQINNKIIELSDKESEEWLKGQNIERVSDTEPLFVIIKNKSDFIGVGKLTKTKILNFMPKERTIR